MGKVTRLGYVPAHRQPEVKWRMVEHVKKIGEHTVGVGEDDDTLALNLRGDVAPEQVQQFFDFMESWSAGRGYVLVTGDVSQLGTISAEARKLVSRHARRVPIRGVVYYGASFAAKLISTLVVSGYSFVTGADISLHFVDDAAEARVWLAKRRAQLQAEAKGGGAT
ncbi:uncharacterized protein SOCE26_087990 [Sorangium cellulosum]|uniref:STAS/SEC14 domain-containing protein n=1 Tax=Sorangium cellulosum TaxID=56 RepID=A0A2L0F6Z5_SORCE|nr:STAS/SEC14 domain-containing protein [Sorangium cellulosum]AUX47281.1 uncharacterized protein SOCE26_087990 [Sorangium cellulosum]